MGDEDGYCSGKGAVRGDSEHNDMVEKQPISPLLIYPSETHRPSPIRVTIALDKTIRGDQAR